MDELIRKLIIRIWKNGRDNGVSVGQTRATKLLYLIEWEYFAWTRKRLTSLDWIYFHYGPWSPTLSTILQEEFKTPNEEEQPGQFRPVHWTPPEFEHINTRLPADLEGIVQRVFETFGAMRTKDIIRYVYFNTEPMRHARRGQSLDFTATRKPLKPFNPVAALDKSVRKKLRERLMAAAEAKLAQKTEVVGDVPNHVLEILSKLDSTGEFVLQEGEVLVTDKDRANIAQEG